MRYLSHQSQDGSRSKGAASNNPHCQAYLALQGTPVMALTLDSAQVGRWHMCKLYWPTSEPTLQGDYFDTVVLQGDEVARRVARHTISPLIAHKLGYEWTAGDWGTPHPTTTLDSRMIHAGSFGTISFRAMNDVLLFTANNPGAAPLAIIHAVVRANCELFAILLSTDSSFTFRYTIRRRRFCQRHQAFRAVACRHSRRQHSLVCSRASESVVRSSGHRSQ